MRFSIFYGYGYLVLPEVCWVTSWGRLSISGMISIVYHPLKAMTQPVGRTGSLRDPSSINGDI